MSLCHAGQLLQLDCRVETDDTSADSQRVRRRHSCASCLEKFRSRELQVPASRCRMLTAEVGHISASRTFFVRWSIHRVLNVEVKAFQLVGSSHRLLVFRSVEDAEKAARCVSQLVPIDGETVGFRLCTNAKTFCPSRNFASGASCLVHLDPRTGAGRSGAAGQSQALPRLGLSGAESGAGPVAGGGTKRARESSPSSEDSATTTAATSNHLGALLGSEPLDSAIDSFLGALISDPPPTSGNLEELPSNTVGSANLTPTCSSSSSDDVHCSPGFDWLMRQEHQLGGSLLRGCSCASLPPSSSLTCCSSCSTAMACAPMMAHVGGSNNMEQQAGGVQASNGRRPSSSQIRSVPNLTVEGQLYVGGETLKASGSSAWTVVSDARVKEVVATFDLGMGELLQLNPKIFRYNGLGGTDRSGKLHVGLIAQDVPDKLAAFCRKRTHVELHSGDTELTEIFILDHSCVPFVCINAIKKHEEQIESFRMRMRGWK